MTQPSKVHVLPALVPAWGNAGIQFQGGIVSRTPATGLVPETALVRSAGLALGRGLLVDGLLAGSLPDIHALGDCAKMGGLPLPYVQPLMQQARSLAATLTDTPTRLAMPDVA